MPRADDLHICSQVVDGVGGGSTREKAGVFSKSVPTMAMRCGDETEMKYLAALHALRAYKQKCPFGNAPLLIPSDRRPAGIIKFPGR